MTDVCSGLPEEKLTTLQENILARRGTPAAHNKLVLYNMREAVKYTKRVSRDEIPDTQLLSLCYAAMMCAAGRFKPDWARFFAFSKAHLRGAVKEYFNSLKIVKKSVTVSRDALKERINENCKYSEGGREEGGAFVDVEAITGEIAEPDFKAIKLREQWALVKPIMETILSDREYMIIDLHYRIGFTLAAIGKKLGVSGEAIRHIRSRALRKIRTKLLGQHLLYVDY